MNELLFFISLIGVFGAVVLLQKVYGKSGLIAWLAFAPVMANILTAKQVTIFGIEATLGTVLFASTFLATDILSEIYGKKAARRAVWVGFVFVCGYIVISQFALLYAPNELDFSHAYMEQLFGTSIRISIISALLFLIANLFDVLIYDHLRKKNENAMWLRNNVATIISNGLENFAFIFLAFYGTMGVRDCLLIATGTTVIEIIAGVCDTPFLYLAKRLNRNKGGVVKVAEVQK